MRDTAKSVATPRGRSVIDESNRTVRNIVLDRLSKKLRDLGVKYEQMGMPSEVPGGITIRLAGRDVEIPIGEAADVVDGIIKPVDFLRRPGFADDAIS